MSPAENLELRRMADALWGDGLNDPGLIVKVDRIDRRLARWDGAIQLARFALGLMGFGGLLFIVSAMARAAGA